MKLEVKLKRKYESKTETFVLINYKRDLRRCVNITYPRDWDCEKLDVFIQNFHDVNVRKPLYVSEWSSLLMKNRLEEIKKLGYRVIAINQLHGYIVRKDGKFLSYQLAKYTSEGGISLTYQYVPSRTHGSGAIQGGESGYNFGFTEFSKEMLNDMMDHPKLYGKVEHYKDFNEYRQLNAGREKSLKKNNMIDGLLTLKSATYRVSWEFTCKTTKILLLYIFLGHNRNVVNTKFPYPIKRLEVIRRFNQKSMAFNQSLS